MQHEWQRLTVCCMRQPDGVLKMSRSHDMYAGHRRTCLDSNKSPAADMVRTGGLVAMNSARNFDNPHFLK